MRRVFTGVAGFKVYDSVGAVIEADYNIKSTIDIAGGLMVR